MEADEPKVTDPDNSLSSLFLLLLEQEALDHGAPVLLQQPPTTSIFEACAPLAAAGRASGSKSRGAAICQMCVH
ncbi:hypothetical protein Rsub_01753 [Raphidocelis subcapitata]|uniref:Uncharacterized protein n=1 Tax=Raphidocelis subcapitata TaxID=307507 RepID=A0A2V0NNB1_9CHLO|nr:hypothetical protein Rsub_01753 [Raphidocelis subcapitata]|eukprot:GBF89036.1 hypothetical protein Rsub_01753 [Raphidocelis subcapitata]